MPYDFGVAIPYDFGVAIPDGVGVAIPYDVGVAIPDGVGVAIVGHRFSGASLDQRPLDQRVSGARTDTGPDDCQEILSKL